MPKHLITLLLFSLLSQFALANKVDNLKSDKDVSAFIAEVQKKLPKKSRYYFTLVSISELKKRLATCDYPPDVDAQNWAKLDINSDGLSDLVVMSLAGAYLILDKGKNNFQIIPIRYSFFSESCEYATVSKQKKDLIIFYRQMFNMKQKTEGTIQKILHTDTLTYKFGELVENNDDEPENLKIDSILFETSGCYGTCAIFSMHLSGTGNLFYHAEYYNKLKGDFKSKITADRLSEIMNVLNYIKINGVDNDYRVLWTDDQTATLTIKFSDGHKKTITDYGMVGTFGLQKLYSLLFDLRDNQSWQKIK